MMSRRCGPDVCTSQLAQPQMLWMQALLGGNDLGYSPWFDSRQWGLETRALLSPSVNFGSRAPFPLCLLTPRAAGFTHDSCSWRCSWKKLPQVLDFLFLLHASLQRLRGSGRSAALRAGSRFASDASIAARVLCSADSEWAHSTGWGPGWPKVAETGLPTFLMAQRGYGWKAFSHCSFLLLLTGCNIGHTRPLSLISPKAGFGQMTFMDSWVYFVQVEATIKFIGMYGFSQLFNFFFLTECICKELIFQGGWNPQKASDALWYIETENFQMSSEFLNSLKPFWALPRENIWPLWTCLLCVCHHLQGWFQDFRGKWGSGGTEFMPKGISGFQSHLFGFIRWEVKSVV